MKKKKKLAYSEPAHEHPYGKVPWSDLNNNQKARLLLDSNRMLDEEAFLKEFKSWETPDTTLSEQNKKL